MCFFHQTFHIFALSKYITGLPEFPYSWGFTPYAKCNFNRKTCLVGLLIAQVLQRECSFFSAKSNELTCQQDMFCFNHTSAFYASNKNRITALSRFTFIPAVNQQQAISNTGSYNILDNGTPNGGSLDQPWSFAQMLICYIFFFRDPW